LEIGSIERYLETGVDIPLIIVGFGVVFDKQAVIFVEIVKVIDVFGFGEMVSD